MHKDVISMDGALENKDNGGSMLNHNSDRYSDSCRRWRLASEERTMWLGAQLAAAVKGVAVSGAKLGMTVFLEGEPGAGKSCLVRGFLRSLGWQQAVPSPSFSLREDYYLPGGGCVAHLDLYRLKDPEELCYLGWEELWNDHWIVMVEWPKIGAAYLPPPDLVVTVTVAELMHAHAASVSEEAVLRGEVQSLEEGRIFELVAVSARGRAILQHLPTSQVNDFGVDGQ